METMVAFVFKWAWLKKKEESEAAPSFKIKLIFCSSQSFSVKSALRLLNKYSESGREYCGNSLFFFFERVKRKKNNTEPLANKQPGQEKGGLFRASLNGSDWIIKVDEYIFHGYHMKEPSLPE